MGINFHTYKIQGRKLQYSLVFFRNKYELIYIFYRMYPSAISASALTYIINQSHSSQYNSQDLYIDEYGLVFKKQLL